MKFNLESFTFSFPTSSMIWVVCVAMLITSCEGGLFGSESIDEGIIEYEVSYPYFENTSLMTEFMPDLMVMKFKDNQYHNEISVGGAFSTNLITNCTEKTIEQYVDVFGEKIAIKLDQQGTEQMLDDAFEQLTIIHTNETDSVAGYLCKKAIAIFDDVSQPEIVLYYTTDIKLTNPNWCNQFFEIDGVLLRYEIEQHDLRTRFTAISVQKAELTDADFKIEEEYEDVTTDRMMLELQDVFDVFK